MTGSFKATPAYVFCQALPLSVFSSPFPEAELLPTPRGANSWMWASPDSDLSSVGSRMLLVEVGSPAIKYHQGASHHPQWHLYAPKEVSVYVPAIFYEDTQVSYSMSTCSTQLYLISAVIYISHCHHSLVK